MDVLPDDPEKRHEDRFFFCLLAFRMILHLFAQLSIRGSAVPVINDHKEWKRETFV